MNWRLAVFLTQRSIRYHRVIALITVAGVALGTCVMASVMVVDDNTARSERQLHERRALRAERSRYGPQQGTLGLCCVQLRALSRVIQ